MTMMHQRDLARQESPQISVVPDSKTKHAARIMLRDLHKRSGYDIVAENIHRVTPDQMPALMAMLLNSGKVGRPRKAERFSADERRRAHSRYANGDRSTQTVAAEREYQRLHKRETRAAQGAADV